MRNISSYFYSIIQIKRQSTSILKTITNSQYSLLKSFANDILDEMIPSNSMQFKKLVQYKDFIRKLSGRK